MRGKCFTPFANTLMLPMQFTEAFSHLCAVIGECKPICSGNQHHAVCKREITSALPEPCQIYAWEREREGAKPIVRGRKFWAHTAASAFHKQFADTAKFGCIRSAQHSSIILEWNMQVVAFTARWLADGRVQVLALAHTAKYVGQNADGPPAQTAFQQLLIRW